MQSLTKFMAGTLDPIYSTTDYFDEVRNYNVTWETDV